MGNIKTSAELVSNTQESLSIAGDSVVGRAVTAQLHVSPNGDNSDGLTLATAYNTIQAALDAASVDTSDCTLILISPNASGYDINTTGDPTWTGNYILAGTHRVWFEIKNTHGTATSIMKFTGLIGLVDLCFNLGTGSGNGVILTKNGFRVDRVQYVGSGLTGAATALHLDGATTLTLGKLRDVEFLGEGTTHMTALLIDNCSDNHFEDLRFNLCKTAIQIVHADSDENHFHHLHIGDSGIGLDLDAGNEQHFEDVTFHHNTTDVDDEVGDHVWSDVKGSFDIDLEPDNFTGVTVSTAAGADAWGADTEVRAAATSTTPFRVVAIEAEGNANEKFRIRFRSDSGSTHYDDVFIEGTVNAVQREAQSAPSGTEHIFNMGTKISASAKSESGSNSVVVWLKIQAV